MIWMGNDLSLINDWETYLKGIHLQHGMGSLLRWTGALERTHVPACGFLLPRCILKRARVGRGWSPWKHSSLTSLTSGEWDALRRWLRASTSRSLLFSLFISLYHSPSLPFYSVVLSAFPTAQLSPAAGYLIAACIYSDCVTVQKSMRQMAKLISMSDLWFHTHTSIDPHWAMNLLLMA